ncbi:MAG: STAS domain-containing protein [Candidatus Eisenbacteria bacterium]|uniref:Anti-sigma factor antagonist n=1 Tax=Eiseniibacteriota bacterium TaxID=2212470 RepID=A0A849SZ37_UNCEI|nr:STAS domain-containing protein [Candidatus Eisenbacteria bacterium]
MKEAIQITDAGHKGGVDVLRLKGPLDAHNTEALLQRCEPIRLAKRHLVLNLSGVTFLSSSGIGTLLALSEEFGEHGLMMRVASPSPSARTAISLLNLDAFLQVHASEDDATKGLAA